MKDAIVGLFNSKKFLMGLTALLVWVVGKAGLDVDPPVIEGVVGIIALLITGQALADFGKEKAKVMSEAMEKRIPPPSPSSDTD